MAGRAERVRGEPLRSMRLPHGRGDFVRQLAIWLGFVVAYQVARGLADRGTQEALRNARRVIHVEQDLHAFFEPDLQRRVSETGGMLVHAVDWTYWLSQLAVDTLAGSELVNHKTGLVAALANPYASMPSLHAADALIIGVTLAAVARRPVAKALFLLWPAWVCFSLIATSNHFWLDIAAGFACAAAGAGTARLLERRGRRSVAREVRVGFGPQGHDALS